MGNLMDIDKIHWSYAAPLLLLYRVQASLAIFRPQRSWVKSRSDPLPPLGIDKTCPGEVNNKGLGAKFIGIDLTSIFQIQ